MLLAAPLVGGVAMTIQPTSHINTASIITEDENQRDVFERRAITQKRLCDCEAGAHLSNRRKYQRGSILLGICVSH
jgi:hypothetical protein